MSVVSLSNLALTPRSAAQSEAARLSTLLGSVFGLEFSVYHGTTGDPLYLSDALLGKEPAGWAGLALMAAGSSQPEIVVDEPPQAVLAVPVADQHGNTLVALGVFTSGRSEQDVISAPAKSAASFPASASPEEMIPQEFVWSHEVLMRLGQVVQTQWAGEQEMARLREEVDNLSDNLASTYEEISLLYGVTQNLRLSSSDEQLGQITLDWLMEVVPAQGVAIQYLPVDDDGSVSNKGRTEIKLLTAGQCPLDNQTFSRLIQSLDVEVHSGALVANFPLTSQPKWGFPEVRQLIVVPLSEGDNLFGWMGAFNHRDQEEFGTVEANLLSSVAAILGIHSGNIEHYRQQSEFLASVVRALTSAIDAKDPYTCGHSDRVARVAVRLAQQLGLDPETLNTLYMAGLLHDIGKIGIDDNVLRKPGKLTEAEFEHIKLHPELGYKILVDLKQLDDVLPVVLHHHEQWDGSGYPHRLAGENIPYLARIVAVADAFDAMSSDRPYRKGMPDAKVDDIFKAGAGKQWDAHVVDAFFQVREDIRVISTTERETRALDVQQWT